MNNSDNSLDEYNPFRSNQPVAPATENNLRRPQFISANRPTVSVAVINENTPILSNDRESVLKALKIQEEELIRREKEISRRENKLKKTESEMVDERPNNFPPFPRCLPCKPCYYQNFELDFSENNCSKAKLGFYIWEFYSFILFLNIFGTLSYAFVAVSSSEAGTVFGLSILLFLLLCPLSYILWFRPLYKCLRFGNSLSFFMFFLFFFTDIILTLIQSLGINWLGSCGWINSIGILNINIGVGIFMLVVTIGFTVTLVFKIFLIISIQRLFRGSGVSLEQAKAEMARETIRNI